MPAMSDARCASVRHDDHGFTLIELMVAVFLLSGALLGAAAMTAEVVRGNLSGKNQTTATAIAQSCFQENRRVGYSNAGAVPSGGSNSCVAGSSTVTLGGVSFTRTLTVTPTPVDSTNIRTLSVTVAWNEGSGGAKSITMSTVLANGA